MTAHENTKMVRHDCADSKLPGDVFLPSTRRVILLPLVEPVRDAKLSRAKRSISIFVDHYFVLISHQYIPTSAG